MKRSEISKYDPKVYGAALNHESKMQNLRHERKAENQRLDEIKKALQNKLSGSEQISRIQAA
ncbi:MAG TPA: hypothetical protein VGF44_05365 [Terriglobales bacterium]|jgi:hypothetical protein